MKAGLLFFLLAGLTVSAQQKELELDPVTLSSSMSAQKISKTGRNIISIPGEQFSRLPAHSVDELLRYIPGMEVQSRGPQGSQSDIVLRGGTFQQVLVILDGIRLNDPNTGHFSGYIPIAPTEIERIEILKGASSAIYGSEAVGGVINIVTKTFAATLRQGQGSKKQFNAEGMIGENTLLNGSIGGFYQKNNTAVGGGWLSDNSKGQLQRGARGYFHNNTASLSFKQRITEKWNIAIRSSYDSRDFGAQNFYTTFVSDTASEQVTTSWNQLQVQYKSGKHIILINSGFKAVKDNFLFNPSSIPNTNRSYLFQTLVTDNYHVAGNANLVSGVQFQQKWIQSNDRGNHNLSQMAGFIIWNQSLNNFSYSPSLRLDYAENSGTELIPQLNLSYRLEKFQLRGSIGKTIREADFTERYNNYNKAFVSGGSIGNPNLEAERSFSYEAGADFWAGNNFKLSATFFRRQQRNVIDFVTTPYAGMPRKDNLSPTGTYALASNVARVNTSGLETDILYSKNIDAHRSFWGTFGLTWLDDETGDAKPSFYISSHAKFLANFNLEYTDHLFSFSVNGLYKHRTPQQAMAINAIVSSNYFTMNTKISCWLIKQRLNIFTELDNIFNVKAADLLGSQIPGRWWMGGLKMSLAKD
ncbi:MAG: TonB-dependent receptor [Bacteroidetes bacterium]|nr:TonB-dependent receptor [Bacteroidota bacterium]